MQTEKAARKALGRVWELPAPPEDIRKIYRGHEVREAVRVPGFDPPGTFPAVRDSISEILSPPVSAW